MNYGFDPNAADGIQPCDGWTLEAYPEDGSDRVVSTGYLARRGEERIYLKVSRFQFTASQERFDWLVRAGFPGCPGITDWTNSALDAQLELAALRKAA